MDLLRVELVVAGCEVNAANHVIYKLTENVEEIAVCTAKVILTKRDKLGSNLWPIEPKNLQVNCKQSKTLNTTKNVPIINNCHTFKSPEESNNSLSQ